MPADSDLGPAMRALNDRQRRFVVALMGLGSRANAARAARVAGYIGNADTVKVTGHRLAHSEKVQAALLEEGRRKMSLAALAGVAVVAEAIGNRKLDMRTRLKASEIAMDRGGMHSVHEQRVVHEESRQDNIRLILDYCKQTGQDPRKYLGSLTDVVDADFTLLEQVPAA